MLTAVKKESSIKIQGNIDPSFLLSLKSMFNQTSIDFETTFLLSEQSINNWSKGLNMNNKNMTFRPKVSEGSFSEMKAIFPDGTEYLLIEMKDVTTLLILIEKMGSSFDEEKFINLCKKIKTMNLKTISTKDIKAFYDFFNNIMINNCLESNEAKGTNEDLLQEYLLNIEDSPLRPYVAALIFNFIIDQGNLYIKREGFIFKYDLDNNRLENTTYAFNLLKIIKASKEEDLKKNFNEIYSWIEAALEVITTGG